MKKWFIVLLALAFLTGCSGSKAETPAATEAPTAAPTAAPTEAPTEAPTAAPTEVPKTETVIVDNENLIFSITKTEVSSWGYTVKCHIENKTDKNFLVTWEDVSVDDSMIDPFWAERVLAGKKANSDITFYELTEASKIEFKLLVMPEVGDSEYDRENAFISEVFTYEP